MAKPPPDEVAALEDGLVAILNTTDAQGRRVGDSQFGVYLFYDYDGEPIYVGQTGEGLRTRIRRHLTNQRTDAVAMSVLDPFEVAEIELWPLWDATGRASDPENKDILNRAEYTVYQKALRASSFKVILNEKEVAEAPPLNLPYSTRGNILPSVVREQREHPDLRVARRAQTIASLARRISERRVARGLRQTLWAQARRLEQLAKSRLDGENA